MSRRVILLAYHFPPLAGIASERAAALSRHLKTLGWEPTVITPRSGFYHRAAVCDEVDVPVVRTRSIELSRLLRAAYGGTRSTGENPGLVVPVGAGRLGERARRFVRDYVYIPDPHVGWIPFAVAAAARASAGGRAPTVIYSSAFPYSAHLAAMAVSRRAPHIPWVAEFRDPWSFSGSQLRRRIDVAFEHFIVRNADHVVMATPALRKALLAAHADITPEKVSVVTNGFEPLPQQAVPSPDEPMTVLYAGTVSPGEDMAPVLAALDRLAQRRPGRFRLHVLGPPEAWQAGGLDSDRSWLVLESMVSPAEARMAMAQSSVLLHVQRHPAYADALPGKLFEYIGARRPIVAVCPPESDMASLLRKHADVRLVSPEALDGLIGELEHLLDEHGDGRIQQPRVPVSLTAPLRRSEQATKLAAIFEDVVDRRGGR